MSHPLPNEIEKGVDKYVSLKERSTFEQCLSIPKY